MALRSYADMRHDDEAMYDQMKGMPDSYEPPEYPSGLCFTVRGDLREDMAPGEQRAEIWEAERDGGVIAVGGSMGDLWLQLAELGGETA